MNDMYFGYQALAEVIVNSAFFSDVRLVFGESLSFTRNIASVFRVQ
jgi:hypothetical protein